MPRSVTPSAESHSGVTPADFDQSPATVVRAVAFIDVHASRDITLIEIADAARLGTRALQLVFRTHYDSTPLEYLRHVRMARAHADLQQADPTLGATVGSVATRWMFTNPGRFAGQYRRRYGCSPGKTLRAGPPTVGDATELVDLGAALAALGIDPDDPADADDLDAVSAVWLGRTLGPMLGPVAPNGSGDGLVLRLPVRPTQ